LRIVVTADHGGAALDLLDPASDFTDSPAFQLLGGMIRDQASQRASSF
jgi:hypothetical protein